MKSVPVNERIADISNRCGFSEDTVRAVLKAETDSTIEYLAKGRTVTLSGRCTLTPCIKRNINSGDINQYLSVTAKPVATLKDKLAEHNEVDIEEDEEYSNLDSGVSYQIPSLL